MQNIYDLAHEMARSLKETDQFKEYQRCKALIDADESLKKMMDDFNAKSMLVQSALMTGQQPDEEAMQQVQSASAIIMQDPTCMQYINAQFALSQIINDIYKILGETVDGQ